MSKVQIANLQCFQVFFCPPKWIYCITGISILPFFYENASYELFLCSATKKASKMVFNELPPLQAADILPK